MPNVWSARRCPGQAHGRSGEDELSEQLQTQAAQIAAFQDNELQLRRDRAELEAGKQQLELDVQRKLDEERTDRGDGAC